MTCSVVSEFRSVRECIRDPIFGRKCTRLELVTRSHLAHWPSVVIQSARRTHVEVHFHVPDLHLQLLQHVRVLQVEVLNGLQAGHVHVQASQISEHAQRGCVAQAELEVTAAGHTETDEGGERVF